VSLPGDARVAAAIDVGSNSIRRLAAVGTQVTMRALWG